MLFGFLSRFFECERRCDKDPCCRGIGYVQDSGVPGMKEPLHSDELFYLARSLKGALK